MSVAIECQQNSKSKTKSIICVREQVGGDGNSVGIHYTRMTCVLSGHMILFVLIVEFVLTVTRNLYTTFCQLYVSGNITR